MFAIEQGLRKARTLWPSKRVPGDTGACRRVAEAVVSHLELGRVRCFRAMPRTLHRTPPERIAGSADEALEGRPRPPLSQDG